MLNDDAQTSAGEPSAYHYLTVERRGLAAWVTLNRPEVHNAFNEALIAELRDTFTRLSADDDIRAVVLQGAGRSFCAGADLNWMRASLEFTHEQNVADALRM
ncbi:MAG TPA: enoyl-CoA hydratase-related protein, partial [Ktedonobacterales bacterium]